MIRKLKTKIDEVAIKAYVKYTVMMWQVEDEMKFAVDELKGYLKLSK